MSIKTWDCWLQLEGKTRDETWVTAISGKNISNLEVQKSLIRRENKISLCSMTPI